MDISLLEKRAADVLARFDPTGARKARLHRPFMIELYGTPKSGKSTMKDMLKHFFIRNGYAVSSPTEGAEVIEWRPRIEPDYNLRTAEYALGVARDRCFSKDKHIVIFDRAVFDGIVRMEYYRENGKITRAQQTAIERYYLLPYNTKNLFDLHICLVCDPKTAIRRELAKALTKKDGETMNPKTLQGLLDAHERIWTRLRGATDPAMLWHDSTTETEEQTAASILSSTLDVFERRLATLPPL